MLSCHSSLMLLFSVFMEKATWHQHQGCKHFTKILAIKSFSWQGVWLLFPLIRFEASIFRATPKGLEGFHFTSEELAKQTAGSLLPALLVDVGRHYILLRPVPWLVS